MSLPKKILRFEAMEDRCMLAVDSGIGAFAYDAVYEPQIREEWTGQYIEVSTAKNDDSLISEETASDESLLSPIYGPITLDRHIEFTMQFLVCSSANLYEWDADSNLALFSSSPCPSGPHQHPNPTMQTIYADANGTSSITLTDMSYHQRLQHHSQNVSTLTYSIQGGESLGSFAMHPISPTLMLFTPNGHVGSASIVVTATDQWNQSCEITFTMKTYAVTGFEVEERAWGETDWHKVEDGNNQNWHLLWGENEYRWRPIIVGMDMYTMVDSIRMVAHPIVNCVVNLNQSVVFAQTMFDTSYNSPYIQQVVPLVAPSSYVLAHALWVADTQLWSIGTPSYNECAISVIIGSSSSIYPDPDVRIKDNSWLLNGKLANSLVTNFTTERPRIGKTSIQSVGWITRSELGTRNPETSTAADLAKLETHDGAYRTFPEQTTPDSPNYNKVEAKVTLANVIPADMTGSVSFKIFDPKNALAETSPSVFLPNSDDNNGSMTFSSGGNTKYVYGGDTEVSMGFEIDPAHAGDNFIVAAHPSISALNNCRFYTQEDTITSGSNPTTSRWPRWGRYCCVEPKCDEYFVRKSARRLFLARYQSSGLHPHRMENIMGGV